MWYIKSNMKYLEASSVTKFTIYETKKEKDRRQLSFTSFYFGHVTGKSALNMKKNMLKNNCFCLSYISNFLLHKKIIIIKRQIIMHFKHGPNSNNTNKI